MKNTDADTKEKQKPRKPEKFLFDAHLFDDDHEEEEEEEEPPPPVFSEEELHSAQKNSYDRGKSDGLAQAEASREKQIAVLIQTITQNFTTLFGAEDERAAKFEGEVIALVQSIYEKTFPLLNEHHGLDEIIGMITTVLEKNQDQPEIIIEVHPDYAEDVKTRLEPIKAGQHGKSEITITGNDALGPGDCRLYWNDGGALRDISGISGQIENHLKEILADKPTLQDNRNHGPDLQKEQSADSQVEQDEPDNTNGSEAGEEE